MAHYLITGVAGFIAAGVAEQLLDGGHRVLGIDNLNDTYDPSLKEFRLKGLLSRDGMEFVKGDISDKNFVEGLGSSGKVDAVINLAARVGVRQSVDDPQSYITTNMLGTSHLLDFCVSNQVRKFILASTSSIYGDQNTLPYKEDADLIRPLSPYAASKLGAEGLAHSYHHIYGFDVSILRYFTVYGPAGRPDMSVFRFVQRISEGMPICRFGDGEQSRDFTYIDDIARGTILALNSSGFQIFNLGGDHPYKLNALIELIERRTGHRAEIEEQPRHKADMTSTWADITHAREELGWSPGISFEDGVDATVSWYESQRSWASLIITQ